MDTIRRAFDEACDELSIEPQHMTVAKRDQLVTTVLERLKSGSAKTKAADSNRISLPAAVRLA